MKKTLLGTALLFALAQALPMDAQKQVRLTFNRAGGTAVSNVTVNVTDESGNAINGVTATLQSIKQGTGTDANATATDVALKSGYQLDTHPEILCASYSNGKTALPNLLLRFQGSATSASTTATCRLLP